MANILTPFKEVVKGFAWLGKKVGSIFTEAGKVVTVVPVVEKNAAILAKDGLVIIKDAGALAIAAVKDGGKLVTELETVIADLKAGNVASVWTDLQKLFQDSSNVATFADILSAVKTLAQDANSFGAAAEEALEEIEAAVK